ncbi:MAG: hypothetical protein H0U62_11625 [Actinobacteria bacterium]|nr:hypothetical protein [Actinomycetota bacterium]
MRAYRALLAHLVERDPGRLADLPRGWLAEETADLLSIDEVYLVEQVAKKVNVLDQVAPEVLADAALRALDGHRVDDFCFLDGYLPERLRPDPERIRAAYRRLLRRGNAAGVEQLAARTGVPPVVDERTALRAYAVLAAAGRPGAIDYVRQLSGVLVTVAAEDLRTGAHTLLAADRYVAMVELAALRTMGVDLDPALFDGAIPRAAKEGELDRLAAAATAWGADRKLIGFAAHLDRVLSTGAFAEFPALFALFADANEDDLPDAAWRGVVEIGTAAALRFVFRWHPDDAFPATHAERAYRIGVTARDRELVRLACTRGGAVLRAPDATALFEGALDDVDLDWLCFASDRLRAVPAARADAVQLFLAEVGRRSPGDLGRASAATGATPDPRAGRRLLALLDGDAHAMAEIVTALTKDSMTGADA